MQGKKIKPTMPFIRFVKQIRRELRKSNLAPQILLIEVVDGIQEDFYCISSSMKHKE